MYLHIGGSKIIFLENMIGIFNIDLSSNQNNGNFLKNLSAKSAEETEMEMNKNSSIIMTKDEVYYSTISPLTLAKRIDKNE